MGEMMALEGFPFAFDVVQFGGVFGQPLGPKPVLPRGERVTRGLAGMDRPVVDNDGDGFARGFRARLVDLGAVEAVEPFEQRDDIGTALGSGGLAPRLAQARAR